MNKETISIEQILSNLKIDQLNEMQVAAIEAYKTHNDIILLSSTGTGKTLAYLLPVVEAMDSAKQGTQAIVIVPSRELALQIEQVFRSMGTGLKITACYGGHLRETEENNLLQAPAIIVGTPGRLADHIRRGNIHVETIETLVLDEFDKSIELGFQEEMSFIIDSLKAIKKRMLTSATGASEIPEFIGLDDPLELDFLEGTETEMLDIQVLKSDDRDKVNTLFRLICHIGNRPLIVFCNHRDAVERTSNLLKEKGIVNVFYHGAMEQNERESALAKFRNGTSSVLVTTDLASRGLDIPHIRYIIHFHIPSSEEVFTHRNGRTARMDASGTAILIIADDEKVPSYISPDAAEVNLPENIELPEKPKWSTLFIAAGKKDKVNKVDIVGFLSHKGELKKEDIGLIEVKDFYSFVGVRKSKLGEALQLIKGQKIKNKNVKIDVAR